MAQSSTITRKGEKFTIDFGTTKLGLFTDTLLAIADINWETVPIDNTYQYLVEHELISTDQDRIVYKKDGKWVIGTVFLS